MVTVATVLILWVVFYEVGTLWQGNPSSALDHPPQLFVDLEAASDEELQLLPDVGPKTARAWRATLDDSTLPLTRVARDLEVLPNVGPVRSLKLAPFLVESESASENRVDPAAQGK
jgi:hypothetical protein